MLAKLPSQRLSELFNPLHQCQLCPRNCKTNRLLGERGICGSDASFNVSSICLHTGEEPVLVGEKGICNVFFSRCNLACIYCQNHQISNIKGAVNERNMTLDEVVESISNILDTGCKAVGFVSPSHYIPHVKAIIETLRLNGRNPVFIYNTNAYDHVSEIKALEDYIDIYLPDFKYADNGLARRFSKVSDYHKVAHDAISEMYRQRGSTLVLDEDGSALRGLIIRHLVLPGYTENSIHVLNEIADISASIAVSLMAQYYPTPKVQQHPDLGRVIYESEYEKVKLHLHQLGFYKGWVQELESSSTYRPDFESQNPFLG